MIKMALHEELMAVHENEESCFTVTIQRNGRRTASSAILHPTRTLKFDSSSWKRKIILENGTNKGSLIEEQPCGGKVSHLFQGPTVQDKLTSLQPLSCAVNGMPNGHYSQSLNGKMDGIKFSNNGGYRIQLIDPCPQTSSTVAEDDIRIEVTSSHRLVAPKRRCLGVSGVSNHEPSHQYFNHGSGKSDVAGLVQRLENSGEPDSYNHFTPVRHPSRLADVNGISHRESSAAIGSAVLNNRITLPGAASELSVDESACLQSFRRPTPLPTIPDGDIPEEETQVIQQIQPSHQGGSHDSAAICEEPAETTPKAHCQLPFNGHFEDRKHYRDCPIVLQGIIMREEHSKWLNAIESDHSCVSRIINHVIGQSCQRILLNGKCTEQRCQNNHTAKLSFEFPPTYLNTAFDVLTKWFLENTKQPDFRAILRILSQLPKNHDNIIMIVMSYSLMVLKLSNKMYRKALCIKLVEIMVKTLDFKPWEAVRTLLVFFVTPEMEQSGILDVVSSLEVSNKSADKQNLCQIYQSVSCLWHVNKNFVCPPDLIIKILKECLVEMPEDLKLTKDRILSDMMKWPRIVLYKRYHLIDKFLSKYYPMNSALVRVFRSSVLCGNDVSKSAGSDHRGYESCRIRNTGPVNPKWNRWSVQEARAEAFQTVLKNATNRQQHKSTCFRPLPDNLMSQFQVEFGEEPSTTDCLTLLAGRCYNDAFQPGDLVNDVENLGNFLRSGKLDEVAKIISSYDNPHKKNLFDRFMKAIQREFKNCDKDEIHRTAVEVFWLLTGSLSIHDSPKSAFARMISCLLMEYYKDSEYPTALRLIKCMRIVGVDLLEHVPKPSRNTYVAICCDILFQGRFYLESLRTLNNKHSLILAKHPFDHFTNDSFVLESLVKGMFKRFLKERLADHAMWVFRIIFSAQKNLHDPFDIGKFYEGVVFLSFIRTLKNACAIGEGANLFVTVDRVCGNSERFHSITYRSLLVELHRVKSPEDVIRRTLWICLQKRVYPDFSKGPMNPLVLESHLAKEEISIYLKYYFSYFVSLNDIQLLTNRPFIIKFTESPSPDMKPFPVSNDIMKTPRAIPEALERLKTALDEMKPELNIEADESSVTIPLQGIRELLNVFGHEKTCY